MCVPLNIDDCKILFHKLPTDVFVHTHLSVNVIISSNAEPVRAHEEENARGGHGRLLRKQTEFLRATYVTAPAGFKTPIVNVTHSERRHIAAFVMRGVRRRALCAKLTMRDKQG